MVASLSGKLMALKGIHCQCLSLQCFPGCALSAAAPIFLVWIKMVNATKGHVILKVVGDASEIGF